MNLLLCPARQRSSKLSSMRATGYFHKNSYKNSRMSEIAAEAGISKSLLFHYFH